MLKLKGIYTYHGPLQVLKNITFNIAEGEIVAIVGANGAGKSTLLGTIAGVYTPRQGEIRFAGAVLPYGRAEKIVEMGLSLVPERRQIFDALSVRDNLLLGAYHRIKRRDSGVERDFKQVLEMFPRLGTMLDRPGGLLSGGEQQMLAIGRALMARPRLMMLDEPSLGLAPKIVADIFDVLLQMRQTLGLTVLLVEQNVVGALSIADRGFILERGNIVLEGKGKDLLNHDDVKRSVLGK